MEKKKYRLKGHESFILREGWLTKGLRAVSQDNRLFGTNSGADALGVGTNMAKAIRYWMKTAGLTNDSSAKGVTLTDFGKVVMKNDIYVEDIFTLWLLHINIACNYENATSWNLFFNCMDLTTPFSREEMHDLMKSLLIESTGEESLSTRSIKDDCSAILSMYGRGGSLAEDPEEKKISPFEELGLITHSGNYYVKKRPSYERLNMLVILYLIVDKLNDEGSLMIDYITDGDNMPGKILNLNRIAVNEYLDKLQNAGFITVNRTAGLDIIYPEKCTTMKKIDVVDQYFRRGEKK